MLCTIITFLWLDHKNLLNIIKKIVIGVPLLNNEYYKDYLKYDILEDELESKFDMDIVFADLYTDIQISDKEPEQKLMMNVDKAFSYNLKI